MTSDDQGQQAPAGGWVPEFEGQRPPFQPGHELTVKHGAYSPRYVDPAAEELRLAILEDPGTPAHVRSPINRYELAAMCRAQVQAELAAKSLAEHIDLCGGDLVKASRAEGFMAASLLMHRAEQRAASGRSKLGLNSAAAARLGKDVAIGQSASTDVALRMQQLHEFEEQMKARGWTPPAVAARVEGQGPAPDAATPPQDEPTPEVDR